jgi:hypothetical protein
MSTGTGEMYLCLPLHGQSEETLASSPKVERDRKEGRVQGSGVTAFFSSETGGRMETCLLPAPFPHRTPHKLLHSAFREATRGQ